MTGRGKWLTPLVVGLALGPVGLGVATVSTLVAAPAGAATAVDCSTGVIVAADFGTWGGGINTVCDPQLPDNGADALVATNFEPVGVASYGGLNFICTIGGYPENDPCTSTPPGNAYWSFWYADAGANAWAYSQQGAENLTPQPGSIEAWVFGGDTGASPPPSFPSPNTLRAETTDSVTPTTVPPTTATPPPPVTTVASPPPSTGGSSTGSPTGSSGASTSGPGSHPTSGAKPTVGAGGGSAIEATGPIGPTGVPTGGTVAPHSSRLPSTAADRGGGSASVSIPRIIDAAPTVAGLQPTRSPIPFVIGAVAVLLLAAGGGVIAWRRRRTG